MEYTVNKLARLAGISTRTLRYYDQMGLLKPARVNGSGYRIYGQAQVDQLQQILFYRELGVSLERIKEIVAAPDFDVSKSLRAHREQLLIKRDQLDLLIENVEQTIASSEGRITMTNKRKFEGFTKNMIDENERKYGIEIREKYGESAIKQSNENLLQMTPNEHEQLARVESALLDALRDAVESGVDPGSDIAQRVADLHRQWLSHFWAEYTQEAHARLAQMYVQDERFKAHYDAVQPGTAEFLRDSILIYTRFKE